MGDIAVKKKVKLPGVEGVYEAWCYTGPESTFNSFLVPFMEFEEAYRFMNAFNRSEGQAAWMFYTGGEFFLDGKTYPLTETETEDGVFPLYSIGNQEFSWWDESWVKAE